MTASQVPEPQMIDPLKCMGDLAEGLFNALTYARAGFIQLRQRFEELQQQHEALGEAFDARGVEIEKLKADLAASLDTSGHLTGVSVIDRIKGWETNLRDDKMRWAGAVNGKPVPA